jgi:hypothetical protein
MKHHPSHRRHLPKGQVVAGAAVVVGLAASVGLLLAGDGPDLRAMAAAAAASAASCSVWPMPSAVF